MNSLVKELIQPFLENTLSNYIIYFDIDDTLSNYSQNLKSTLIKDPDTGEQRPIKASDTVDNLDFWLNAPLIPGVRKMVDFAKQNFSQVEILSAVPELSKAKKEETGKRFYEAPIKGKIEWVKKHIGPIKFNWTRSGKEKILYATPNSILIDDKPENVKFFQQYGGIGILFTTPTEVINKLKKIISSPENINEVMYAEPSKFSYPTMLSSLIQYMLSKGMQIRPLPKVKFIEDDVENARDFFGKTAYYNPNEKSIVLYTMDRHPKDVMRSFAHEMIHHEQNCNGKLNNITTQNTNEEGDLPEIEREAYEKGNMMFRNWTDTITEGVLAEGRYDKITNQISSTIFRQWKEDFENGKESSRIDQSFTFEGNKIDIDANISFIPNIGELRVDGGADDETDYIEVRFEVDPEKLPEFWEEISFNLKDVIRHEIEHLTHGEGDTSISNKHMEDDLFIRKLIDAELLPKSQYFKLEKEIDANLQGMYLRAKKEKRSFKDVIDTYLDAQDITSEQKKEILDLWRGRLKALNLPIF